MRRTRVKICGITTARDAAVAVAAGVDALGVVFAPSSRQVSIEQARAVFAQVPPMVARIGVFVDADESLVAKAVEGCGLAAVQFHGVESPERCASAPVPVIKALRVGEDFDAAALEAYRGCVAAILLDTQVAERFGGTGRAFDWRQHVGVSPEWAALVLAGGLTPVNVGLAVRTLRPFAVDVSTGVEELPGHKDREKVHAFTAAVFAADQEG